jgi:uncharacterized protein (DUF58 family)
VADIHPDASLLSPEIAARLAHLSLAARRLASAKRRGRRRVRRIGAGTEMIDTRPYAFGDDPRRIAWSAFARLEKLLVRLVADEAPLRLALVVDESASMRYGELTDLNGGNAGAPALRLPSKLRQAARIAAGLAAVALSGEERVATIASSARRVAATRAVSGRGGLARVLAALDALSAGGATDLSCAASAATHAAGGRALCVILSDLLDHAGALAGARAARMQGHDVALVEVLAPFEIDPPCLDGVDVEDEETGEIVALNERGTEEAYTEALATHRAAVDEGAAALGAVVVRVSTADSFDDVVARALSGGLLRAGAVA